MRGMVVIATTEGLRVPGSPDVTALEGRSVSALAASSDGLWAVVDGRAIWSGRDGDWHDVAHVGESALQCLLPTDAGVLAGTANAHLVRLADGVVETLEGFEGAPGRRQWFTPWGGPPAVRSMAAGADGEVYANVHVGGILRSDDDGASWRPTIDIRTDVHQVITVPGRPGLVLAAAAVGLATSEDGGGSWSVARDGLAASYCRALAVCGDTVLLTASEGPRGRRVAVYRRRLDADGPFEKCTAGLPEWFDRNIDTGCLVATDDLAAFGTDDGRVFVSRDAGATWATAASGLPRILALA
ncbi:MAG: hypothetical protein QOK40_100 [Miltoncostaeaceae bacterium]|nr:hypothetical protein [Miltoncostaeaceae bacterium]